MQEGGAWWFRADLEAERFEGLCVSCRVADVLLLTSSGLQVYVLKRLGELTSSHLFCVHP